MATVYPNVDVEAKPEIVIHFYDYTSGMVTIPLEDIRSITITND